MADINGIIKHKSALAIAKIQENISIGDFAAHINLICKYEQTHISKFNSKNSLVSKAGLSFNQTTAKRFPSFLSLKIFCSRLENPKNI